MRSAIPPTVHVIGAGLAGLAAALRLMDQAGAHCRIALYEAARMAGGRARSFYDPGLDAVIDNGTHVLLGANRAALAHVERLGTRNQLAGFATLPFKDVANAEHWTIDLADLQINGLPQLYRHPALCLSPRDAGYVALSGLHRGKSTVAEALPLSTLAMARLLRPLTIAALNLPPEQASMRLFYRVLLEGLVDAPKPNLMLTARHGLSACFVEPALDLLRAAGATLRSGARLQALRFDDAGPLSLHFAQNDIPLGAHDRVILAVPWHQASALLPGIKAPTAANGIVNVHFAKTPDDAPMRVLGLINSLAEWLFVRPDLISVTISAADRLNNTAAATIAQQVWREIAAEVGGCPTAMPAYRVVKEKRATFAQTPDVLDQRPDTRGPHKRLYLAGDWVNTGLPATLESTIRAGHRAAELCRADLLATR